MTIQTHYLKLPILSCLGTLCVGACPGLDPGWHENTKQSQNTKRTQKELGGTFKQQIEDGFYETNPTDWLCPVIPDSDPGPRHEIRNEPKLSSISGLSSLDSGLNSDKRTQFQKQPVNHNL
jgi:hypothetical protein